MNGVQDYAATLLNKPTRLVIELYASSHLAKPDPVQTAKANGAVKAKAAENQPRGRTCHSRCSFSKYCIRKGGNNMGDGRE